MRVYIAYTIAAVAWAIVLRLAWKDCDAADRREAILKAINHEPD